MIVIFEKNYNNTVWKLNTKTTGWNYLSLISTDCMGQNRNYFSQTLVLWDPSFRKKSFIVIRSVYISDTTSGDFALYTWKKETRFLLRKICVWIMLANWRNPLSTLISIAINRIHLSCFDTSFQLEQLWGGLMPPTLKLFPL